MKKLRFGAALYFLIAIGHVCCLFALDEAFEAYGIKDIMHQMVSGHIWMLYALTIGFAFALGVANYAEVDKAYAKVTIAGAKGIMPPTTEPWGQRTCYIADPEGNLVEIGSFVKY